MDAAAHDPDRNASPSNASPDDAGEIDPLRAERLAGIRAMIDDGGYETTERLEAAVCRLLSVVGNRT
ncbi:MAG: hypothetical protein WBC44_06300 [Planctomycetaceae bacterium]